MTDPHSSERRSKDRQRKCAACKRKRTRLLITAAALTLLLLLLLAVALKGCKDKIPDKLAGIWVYDAYTQYEFDGFGSGCMCLDSQMHLDFSYVTRGDSLHLDFEADYVQDCEYIFSVSGDQMTLVGGEGTAQVGTEYRLTRKGDAQ